MPDSPTRKQKPPPAFVDDHAKGASIAELHRQAEKCERCDLYKDATQVVFGEGSASARVVLVGEQPGQREDEAGRPFVGPAGRLLDECLQEAGVDRSLCYVTNAVKHFKFEQRGKRRLHARPNAGEIQRCAWWLGAELDVFKPRLIVALGATALYSLMGRSVGLTKERGEILKTMKGIPLLVTVHPSYLLRIRDREDARKTRQTFVADLARMKSYLR
jgi:uracil-DNA glycosylase